MEEDIQNYSPTVMFRGTTCTFLNLLFLFNLQKYKNHKSPNFEKKMRISFPKG